jgi:hypothetical protein
MANPDKPRGFRPVKKIDGGMPWNDSYAVRAYMADTDDETAAFGIGTMVQFQDVEGIGTGPGSHFPSVTPLYDEDVSGAGQSLLVYGAIVGVSKAPGVLDGYSEVGAMADLADLTGAGSYAAVAEAETAGTEADVVLHVALAKDWIFEVQSTEVAEVINLGDTLGIHSTDAATGTQALSATTGQSTSVVAESTDEVQFRVVGFSPAIDNDPELADADVWVVAVDAWPYAEGQ